MRDATRPPAPAVWPVVLLTALFALPGMLVAVAGLLVGGLGLVIGLLGLVVASIGAVFARRRARAAAEGGAGPALYWVAFAVPWVLCGLIGLVSMVTVGIPAYLAVRESAAMKVMQDAIVTDGKLTAATGLTATDADCVASGGSERDGARPYVCSVTLSDGRIGTLNVIGDGDGGWTLAPTK
jgi:hypothetical protein